ncbi:helix-turn-helix domain-containing protein [Vagococcus humatus]|nr:helix-turn-helix domain-containing protein [Vagococcus humatus]
MEHLFINRKEQIKLAICKEIIFQAKFGVTFSQIQTKYDLSTTTLNRYLAELDEELNQVFQGEIQLVFNDHLSAYFIESTEPQIHSYFIKILRYHYMKEQTFFIVFEALLHHIYDSVEELAEQINLSPQTIYKQLRLFNQLLEPFGAELYIKNGRSNFRGSEIGLRFFFYYVHWFIYGSVIPLPFEHPSYSDLLDTTDLVASYSNQGTRELTLSQKTKLKIMQAITLYKLKRQHRTLEMSDDFYQDIQFFSHPAVTLFDQFQGEYDKETLDKEQAFFCYAVSSLVFDSDNETRRAEIVKAYEDSHLSIARDVERMLAKLAEEFSFQFQPEGYITSYYLVLIFAIYMKYFAIDTSKYCEYSIQFMNLAYSEQQQTQVNEKMLSFAKEQAKRLDINTHNWSESAFQHLAYILTICHDLNHPFNTIHVLLQITENVYMGEIIRKNIKDFFHSDLLQFTDDLSKADLIISDTYEQEQGMCPQVYLDNPYDASQWERVFAFLSDFLYKHSFYKRMNIH